ncbi:MAG: GDP-mannose 4,6-dehydratase [Verrucomicrobiales bacterium]|nr:GDP-mannose 4,6-dehydratase [Verrucomicrobiales bacterium]
MKKALITGITGQDGSYLADLLLELGYEVHGIARQAGFEAPEQRFHRIKHISNRLTLHSATLESYASLFRVLARNQFDEIYHLAAQSFVAESFIDGFSTLNTNINGTHHLLAAIYETNPNAKFYYAGSSEMFGLVEESPQNEQTRYHPRSPYGISKVTGFHLTRSFREAYSMFCCTGILFNHESPRRGHEYVTRKITSAVARISKGLQKELRLGNLDASRDWGHAKDYVKAMQLMLQLETPNDIVIATGKSRTVREFCDLAFGHVGLSYNDYVVVDERFFRPAETVSLLGDASYAKQILGWVPSITFENMVIEMLEADLAAINKA